MDTKLSIALLSGMSLFLSLGDFAVSDAAGDNMNWSYAMGGTVQANPTDFDELMAALPPREEPPKKPCASDCAGQPQKSLTLTYEDEAMPLAERVEMGNVAPKEVENTSPNLVSVRERMAVNEQVQEAPQPMTLAVSQKEVIKAENVPQEAYPMPPQIETRYVESNPQTVQYPITRQYPISVQYPVTVQRNMTVEQPVVMQQPVIVRRPVVVQQDVMVRHQPTFVQQQPMIMQQQPAFIQQQPVYVQAPAVPMSQDTLNSLNGMIAQPQFMPAPVMQPVMQPQMPMMQGAYLPYPQQYQVQGQIQAQPVYTTMPPMYVQPQMVQQAPAY